MKTLFLLFLFLGIACAGGIVKPRAFSERTMRFCTKKDLPNPEAKLCYRRCEKRRILGSCKKWKLDFYNLNLPIIHNSFIAAGFKVSVD